MSYVKIVIFNARYAIYESYTVIVRYVYVQNKSNNETIMNKIDNY